MRRDPSTMDLFGPARSGLASQLGTVRTPAAAADPQTSHRAARELQRTGTLNQQAAETLEALRRWRGEPPTSAELAQGNVSLRFTYARRLPDLEKIGFVEIAGKRPCRTNGHQAQTWRVKR